MTKKAMGSAWNFTLNEEQWLELVEGHGVKKKTILEVYL